MKESVSSKQSFETIRTPRELKDYLKVIEQSQWILVVSILILFLGALVWLYNGSFSNIVKTDVNVNGGTINCYISDDDCPYIIDGITVKYANTEAVISEIEFDGQEGYICYLKSDTTVPDGHYEGEIIINDIKPILAL